MKLKHPLFAFFEIFLTKNVFSYKFLKIKSVILSYK